MNLKTTSLQFGVTFIFVLSFFDSSPAKAGNDRLPILCDRGIFPDLDGRVEVPLPPSVDSKTASAAVHLAARTLTVFASGIAVKTYPVVDVQGDNGAALLGEFAVDDVYSEIGRPENAFRITRRETDDVLRREGRLRAGGFISLRGADAEELSSVLQNGIRVSVYKDRFKGISDTDADGIPDQVDVLLGAVKTDLDNAEYDDGFYPIAKKLGDVPRAKGCCTDVVIRALRNAGIDLQSLLQRDIQKNEKAYPQIAEPNSNIDHRRVRNLLVYFKRHFKEIPLDNPEWMPGDIVLFDTLSKKGPDHIGIVAAERSPEGVPLVINAWTYGAVTDAMDLLSFVPVTHHFRVP